MKPGFFARLALALSILTSAVLRVDAITLTITNPWSIGVVDQADLTPANTPGGRIPDPWLASPNNDVSGVLLTITGAPGNWRVDIQKSDVLWDTDTPVEAIRRTNGTGLGANPVGGTAYFTLDGTVQQFFTGNRDRANIRLQFRVQMNEPSANVLPVNVGSLSTNIIITVTDT
jgi:hypothetical protein